MVAILNIYPGVNNTVRNGVRTVFYGVGTVSHNTVPNGVVCSTFGVISKIFFGSMHIYMPNYRCYFSVRSVLVSDQCRFGVI